MIDCFLDELPAFTAWAEQVDVWRSKSAMWLMDVNARSVEVSSAGAVTIHPDELGSTKWFADVLSSDPLADLQLPPSVA